MQVRLLLMAAVLTVSACATSENPSPRENVADAVGTPFYIALKMPVCVATVALAAPWAAVAGLSEPPSYAADNDPRPALDHGIRRNCGPPYVLAPAQRAE